MKYTFTILLFLTMVCAKAQQADSLKKTHAKHLSKDLSISESVANQVVEIMDNYKQNIKKAINDKTLKPEELQAKISLLMDEKNTRLSLILNELQLQKIVPTTERRKDKKSTSTNH